MRLQNLLAFALSAGMVAVGRAQDAAPLLPGENLIVAGIPPIPAEVVESVARYTEFRGAGLASWHPTKREMLIGTRFADVGQVHRVLFPGGARTQLTFFPDGAGGASYQPTSGEYFLWAFLIRNMLAPDSLTLVDLLPAQMASALAGGTVDAVATWEPFVLDAQLVLGDQALTLTDPGVYAQSVVIVAGTGFLSGHRGVIFALERDIFRNEF